MKENIEKTETIVEAEPLPAELVSEGEFTPASTAPAPEAAKSKSTKRKERSQIPLEVFMMIFSSFIVAIAFHCFVLPNSFAPGGVSGISTIINKLTDGKFPASIALLCCNTPLVVLSFIFIKKRFAIYTSINCVCQFGWMELFRRIELWQYVADHRIYAAAATGIIFGIGLTIAFKFGGSSGGSDIIALSIQKKYSATNIAWFILLVDIVVAIASLFVFKENGLEPLFLSLTYLVVMTKTMEMFDDGMHSAIKVEIVTAKPDELAEALMKEMHRGVTSIKVKGMYTHAEKSMLVCIIGKRQLTPLKKLIRKIDPNAFAYTSTATEVLGAGFIPRG